MMACWSGCNVPTCVRLLPPLVLRQRKIPPTNTMLGFVGSTQIMLSYHPWLPKPALK
jgi:hypothetical protein